MLNRRISPGNLSWKMMGKMLKNQSGRLKAQESKREKEKPELPKRKKRRHTLKHGRLTPPHSIFTTLQFYPLMFISLHDHLQAYTLQHLKGLLLQQLLRDILRYLYAVFQNVFYNPPTVLISILYVLEEINITKFAFKLFILLLSQVRLKI